MIINTKILKLKPRTLNKWAEIVTGGAVKAPINDVDCTMCDDTGRTEDGKKCLCHYQKLNEDGYEL